MKWTDRIGRRVKLRDLHIALAVAEAGSMTRAAQALAVSYPVVSKTISELEHTLGVKLFDRSISGVEPTHYGRALLKSGVAVFDEMRKGLQQIESIKQPDVGELRIGSSIVRMPVCFPRSSNDFRESSRARWLTCCLKTSQFSNMTICAIEKLSWCWAGFPPR
jgi:DNA-binding transcriptional LysR family regulator